MYVVIIHGPRPPNASKQQRKTKAFVQFSLPVCATRVTWLHLASRVLCPTFILKMEVSEAKVEFLSLEKEALPVLAVNSITHQHTGTCS